MGRGGSSIVYGKVQLASEGETVEKLVGQLDIILKKFGYPEKKLEEDAKTDEAEEKSIGEAIVQAKPAKDSVVDLLKPGLVPKDEPEPEQDVVEPRESAEEETDEFEEEFPADDKA